MFMFCLHLMDEVGKHSRENVNAGKRVGINALYVWISAPILIIFSRFPLPCQANGLSHSNFSYKFAHFDRLTVSSWLFGSV